MESRSGGSGDVHAHISAQPDKGEGMSGKYEPDEAAAFTQRVRDRAEEAFDNARSRSGDLRDRVGGAAHRARRQASQLFDDAEDSLDSHTGMMGAARNRPMAALGIAFAVGFLLAGDNEEPEHPTSLSKARNQIKGAIMGGISAALSQQLRTFIEDQGGIGAILSALGVSLPGGRGDDYFTPDDDFQDA